MPISYLYIVDRTMASAAQQIWRDQEFFAIEQQTSYPDASQGGIRKAAAGGVSSMEKLPPATAGYVFFIDQSTSIVPEASSHYVIKNTLMYGGDFYVATILNALGVYTVKSIVKSPFEPVSLTERVIAKNMTREQIRLAMQVTPAQIQSMMEGQYVSEGPGSESTPPSRSQAPANAQQRFAPGKPGAGAHAPRLGIGSHRRPPAKGTDLP